MKHLQRSVVVYICKISTVLIRWIECHRSLLTCVCVWERWWGNNRPLSTLSCQAFPHAKFSTFDRGGSSIFISRFYICTQCNTLDIDKRFIFQCHEYRPAFVHGLRHQSWFRCERDSFEVFRWHSSYMCEEVSLKTESSFFFPEFLFPPVSG